MENELNKLFEQLPNNVVLDGELFTFDLSFEEISGCARQTKNVDKLKIVKLKYYIFDCYIPDIGFENRSSILSEAFSKLQLNTLILVETQRISTSIEIMHDEYILQGYEGIMIRNAQGIYKLNYRSVDLQKYKCFIDNEYRIIDVKEATGNDKGTAIFVCEDEKIKETFAVRARGTRESRAHYWTNSDEFIGKLLTVRYQNLTEYGLPRFPVGIAVRDYE